MLTDYEAEIDQLLTQVADLLHRADCRSLYHRPEQYYGDLSRLRKLVQQMRREQLCDGSACGLAPACSDSRFTHSPVPAGLWATLSVELTDLKTRCCRLLTNVVSLNLL